MSQILRVKGRNISGGGKGTFGAGGGRGGERELERERGRARAPASECRVSRQRLPVREDIHV